MGTNNEFPRGLFEAYAIGKITRTHFEAEFSAWQKAHGTDFDCKGTADGQDLCVTYRGVKATLQDEWLVWCMGVKPAGKRRKRLDWRSAGSIYEFKRKVDFALLREWIWKGGGRCRELTW